MFLPGRYCTHRLTLSSLACLRPYFQAICTSFAIESFAKRAGLSLEDLDSPNDGILERRARAEIERWNLGNIAITDCEAPLSVGVDITRLAYPYVPLDAQLQIALYTMISVLIDDFKIPGTAVEEFTERLYTGSSQLHPVLDQFVSIMHGMKEYYLPPVVNRIIMSTVAVIESMVMDNQIGPVTLTAASLSYVTSRRVDNGGGSAYAYFIWDKSSFPQLETYIQMIP